MELFLHSQQMDSSLILKLQPYLHELAYVDYLTIALLIAGTISYLSYGNLWAKPDPYLYKLYERPQELSGPLSYEEGARDIAKQLVDQDKDLVIFWGSQSGTAEILANRLARDCSRKFGINALVADLSDYEYGTIQKIPQPKFVIFLISTYGEGDPSDNTSDFLTYLLKSSEPLLNLRYVAFGLGNSNYVYYNKVIDQVVTCMDRLGAQSLLSVGKADDANSGTEEDFATWRDDLFAMFQQTLGFEEHISKYEPTIEVSELPELLESNLSLGEPFALKLSRKAARDYSAIRQLPLKETKLITSVSSAGKSCLHLEVDIRAYPELKYKTGDHLAIWPHNMEDEVNLMLRVLHLTEKRDNQIKILYNTGKDKGRTPKFSTIAVLFRHHLEISGPVSRDLVANLSRFAPTKLSEAFLRNLSNKAYYRQFLARNHITFARLLEHTIILDPETDWSKLPLAFVIESLRPMTPRYYSISSSSMVSPHQMAVTVAVSASALPEDSTITIPGLATSYLSQLNAKNQPGIYAHIRRSAFKMPFLHKTPIVLVAAGTGIAPFRAFLQERSRMAHISSQEIGKVLLIFGCRHPDEDYLYRQEMEELQNGSLKGKLDIETAFSRFPGQQKCYVQDKLAESYVKDKLVSIICQQDGSLYLCGSTVMAKAAGRCIIQTVKQYQMKNDVGGIAWMESMKRSRRWQEDVWG